MLTPNVYNDDITEQIRPLLMRSVMKFHEYVFYDYVRKMVQYTCFVSLSDNNLEVNNHF